MVFPTGRRVRSDDDDDDSGGGDGELREADGPVGSSASAAPTTPEEADEAACAFATLGGGPGSLLGLGFPTLSWPSGRRIREAEAPRLGLNKAKGDTLIDRAAGAACDEAGLLL